MLKTSDGNSAGINSMKPFYIHNLFEISIIICYQTLCQGTSVPQLPGAADCRQKQEDGVHKSSVLA